MNFLQCARSSYARSPLPVDRDEVGAAIVDSVDEIEAAVVGSVNEIGAAVVGSVNEIASATTLEDEASAADDSSALRLKAAGAALILSFAAIGLGFH